MLRVDGRVLVASVVGVFIVGAIMGFVVAGTGTGTPSTADVADPIPAADDSTPGPTPDPALTTTAAPTGTPIPSDTPVVQTTGTTTATPVPTTVSPTSTPMRTPTTAPTPTVQPETVRPPSTATPTPTPMLIRRFDVAEIERELRALLNDWRAEQSLQPFTHADGALVADLNAMAHEHSVAMADAGQTVHELDNRSSADRYRAFGVYWTCRFAAADGDYFVTPDDNDLEVLARTYAGVAYETPDGTEFNANETAVARDIFERWTTDAVYRERLARPNATRIGIGIETTRDNEVYVTGNVCNPS